MILLFIMHSFYMVFQIVLTAKIGGTCLLRLYLPVFAPTKRCVFAPTQKGNFAKKIKRPGFAPTLYLNDSSLQNLHLIYRISLIDVLP